MPILNYTTEVDEMKSIGEIQGMLGAKGARQITTEYDANSKPTGVSFMLILEQKPFYFQMPANFEGVHRALMQQRVSMKYQTREHARRVTWRIVKNWIEAQLALIEAGQAQMAEVFLPYMVAHNGQTMYQRFLETNVKALQAGKPDVEAVEV